MTATYEPGTGRACSSCETPDKACWGRIKRGGKACCPTCYRTATHGQDDPPPSPAVARLEEAVAELTAILEALKADR